MEGLARASDGGVVDEDVAALEVAGDFFAEARYGGCVGEVAREDGGVASFTLDLVADFVQAFGVAGGEEDVGAEGGEAEGGGGADSAGGAGDEGDLRGERGHGSIIDARCGWGRKSERLER